MNSSESSPGRGWALELDAPPESSMERPPSAWEVSLVHPLPCEEQGQLSQQPFLPHVFSNA